MGYDTPRKLGDHEPGGRLSLPIWMTYMRTGLNGVPIAEPAVPEGVVNVGGEWYYNEYVKSGGVTSLGITDSKEPAGHPHREKFKRCRQQTKRNESLICSRTDQLQAWKFKARPLWAQASLVNC